MIATPLPSCWPPQVPTSLSLHDRSIWDALERTAQAYPQAVGMRFLGRDMTWSAMADEALRLAGALQQRGLRPGDRVVLLTQNCPESVLAFHAIVRAGGVVVPLNPMNKADELEHYLADARPRMAVVSADVAGELVAAAARLPDATLTHLIGFDLTRSLPAQAPDYLGHWPASWAEGLFAQVPRPPQLPGVEWLEWDEVLATAPLPASVFSQADDLAIMPYTSGTTGLPKGCMHAHRSVMHNAEVAAPWLDIRPGDRQLIVVPMFHITGLVMGMLACVRHACELVILPRWDRRVAALTMAAVQVTHWPNIPTMVIDLLGDDDLRQVNLSALRYIGGGGAAMPDAVAQMLHQTYGLTYVEGYGLTETAAPTHINPAQAARRHCLGIPHVQTRALVIDPDTLNLLPDGEVGEIVVSGPQVFMGYWEQAQETERAFVRLDGERWFRTGDLGRRDADGYFYMADRLKRMINASGFKVWPAEVEALLHRHPGVREACVIAVRDPYRGESVKAIVVRRTGAEDLDAEQLMAWSKAHMAAYKYPRSIEFVEALPKTASGKILWRQLQQEQDARDGA